MRQRQKVFGQVLVRTSITKAICGLCYWEMYKAGKTAQALGVVSKLADEDFELFVYLTTDNVLLQKQTLERAKETLGTFDVLGEYDEVELLRGNLSKPILIVIKKNTHILRKWRNNLSSSGYCEARPIVIIDDEGDAASLNTVVNENETSAINNHLNSLQNLASSSVYFQVTATPQSILLQTEFSGWKPEFVHFIEPGENYIGGDFVYSDPISFCIRLTGENELDQINQDSEFIPQGLKDSLMSFIVICSHLAEKGETLCNFLIHPSVRIADHETFANRIGEHLNLLLSVVDEEGFENDLHGAWVDLQITKPDITHFEDIKQRAATLLEEQQFQIIVLNSTSSVDVDYQSGFNIIIGGNSLGRGITLPKLQVVYYCRRSQTPQADTYWQHSRMFGYDRIVGLLRVFIPPDLHRLFSDLSSSNKSIINQVKHYGTR